MLQYPSHMRTAVLLHCTVLVVGAYACSDFVLYRYFKGWQKAVVHSSCTHSEGLLAAIACLHKLLLNIMRFTALLILLLLLRRAAAFITYGQVGAPSALH
jgi:hypothetical protein